VSLSIPCIGEILLSFLTLIIFRLIVDRFGVGIEALVGLENWAC
jgi:hypothetical protein